MDVIDDVESGKMNIGFFKPGGFVRDEIAEAELLHLAKIGQAMDKFEQLADPNRTSIVPVGNGQTGLYYAICYDDETIVTGKTVAEVVDKFGRWINLQQLTAKEDQS